MVSFSEQRLLNHNIVKSLLSYLYAFFHKPDSYQPQPQAPAVPFVSCCLAVFNRAGFIQCVWFHKSHLGFCSEPQEPRGGVAGQVGHGPDEGLVEADGVDRLRRSVYAAAQGHGANGGGSGFRALLVQFHASDLADFVHLQEPAGLGVARGEIRAQGEGCVHSHAFESRAQIHGHGGGAEARQGHMALLRLGLAQGYADLPPFGGSERASKVAGVTPRQDADKAAALPGRPSLR